MATPPARAGREPPSEGTDENEQSLTPQDGLKQREKRGHRDRSQRTAFAAK